jgi:P27 family predicted phage terminase small subunit
MPTALKIARGNPGKRPLRKDEPEFPAGFGEKPSYLSGIASTEWDRVVPTLDQAKLTNPVARAAIEMYCVAYGRWRRAEDKMGDEDMIYDKEHGRWQRNPLLLIANKAQEQCLKCMIEFGMTPSSKTKAAAFVSNDKAKIHDPWGDI